MTKGLEEAMTDPKHGEKGKRTTPKYTECRHLAHCWIYDTATPFHKDHQKCCYCKAERKFEEQERKP